MKLFELQEKQIGCIHAIHMEEHEKMRLLQIGIYEGGRIQMEHKGKKQHPSIFYIRGNFIMLRYDAMHRIEVYI